MHLATLREHAARLGVGHVARVRALGFKHEPLVAYKLRQHRIDGGGKRHAELVRRALGIVAELLWGLYRKCSIHTNILLLVRFLVKYL